MMTPPLIPALSINQPWASLIAHGYKDIENRTWVTAKRGLFLIHAGLKIDIPAMRDVENGVHPATGDLLYWIGDLPFPTGGIIGEAQIIGCVKSSRSPWFVGPYGFVLMDARPLPFQPCKGALGFFNPNYSSRYSAGRSSLKTASEADNAR